MLQTPVGMPFENFRKCMSDARGDLLRGYDYAVVQQWFDCAPTMDSLGESGVADSDLPLETPSTCHFCVRADRHGVG